LRDRIDEPSRDDREGDVEGDGKKHQDDEGHAREGIAAPIGPQERGGAPRSDLIAHFFRPHGPKPQAVSLKRCWKARMAPHPVVVGTGTIEEIARRRARHRMAKCFRMEKSPADYPGAALSLTATAREETRI